MKLSGYGEALTDQMMLTSTPTNPELPSSESEKQLEYPRVEEMSVLPTAASSWRDTNMARREHEPWHPVPSACAR